MFFNTALSANDDEYSQQRKQYVAANNALNQGHKHTYNRLIKKLKNYPLYPYLIYSDLSHRISYISAEQVNTFRGEFSDTPLADQLYFNWLRTLANNGKWQDFNSNYQPSNSTELQCHYIRSIYHTGDKQRALEMVQPLWVVGHSQPKSCDSLFATWIDAGYLTSDLAWQRFQLAIGKGKYRLARYLVRYLNGEQKSWAQLWLKLKKHPERVTKEKRLKEDASLQRRIVVYAIKRLARYHADKAWNTWEKIKGNYSFTSDDIQNVERRLTLATLLQKDDLDDPNISHVLDNPLNIDLQEWRIRAALAVEDWEAAMIWLERIDPEIQNTPRWQYWKARALNKLSEKNTFAALEIYNSLAEMRHYYGFMAADRLGVDYQLKNKPVQLLNSAASDITQIPSIQRAKELFLLNKIVEARREWRMATKAMDDQQLAQAAKLADEWGWHDRAIYTIAGTPYLDDLQVRFPLAYRQQVMKEANIQNIDPSWVLAVIRQESAFMADARSSAGALGLMQIMPSTGKELGRLLKTPIQNTANLLDTGTNIRFGVKHLKRNFERLQDNIVPATAAYNAGYYKVRKWLPDNTPIEADQWVESIPYKETRNYVQNILAYAVIYNNRLEQKETKLADYMSPIYPSEASIKQKN